MSIIKMGSGSMEQNPCLQDEDYDKLQVKEKCSSLEICVDLKRALTQKEEFIQRLQFENNTLSCEAKEQNLEVKQLRLEIMKNRAENNSLGAEVKEKTLELKWLLYVMAKYRSENERLSTETKEQNLELKRLYQEMVKHKIENERLGVEVKWLHKEVTKYRTENESLRVDTKHQMLEIKRLQQEIAKKTLDKKELERELQRAKDMAEGFKKDVHNLMKNFPKLDQVKEKNEALQREKEPSIEGSKFPSLSQMHKHPEFVPVFKKYNLGHIIGEGGNGQVRIATRKFDNATVALKIIPLIPGSEWLDVPGEKGKVPLEVGLLKRVCAVPAGPNIIQMSEYILGRRYMFIFMELLESYTSLEDVIYKKTGPLSEEKAKHAFRQIVQAVLHCHSRGVFHNDIKPNNIMYQTTTGQIKLIDFGYGDLLKEKYYPHAPGTPAYWPPEWYLFRKYKAEPVTVWTLGITLFELLCGNRPFKEKMEILECKISYTNEISGECKDLIEKCLCSHPIDRLTLKDISIHSWLR
ncbi:uncharacterized protein LOC127528848 [Erpetoichthys calabaricus]|uniref:uncharacterized protein LOC127528848 n=1 Tax=Erpetoichthys calabaricus TaxID=27687 RepID=UPI002234DAE7|nr:uncharacterized protein LOC127528848 [Erpetoichthys calabaricus]